MDTCFYKNANKYIYNVTYTESNIQKQTLAQYKEIMGSAPNTLIPYIVSSKTVLNDPAATFKKVTASDGTECFTFTLYLNPQTSVKNYVNQISHMSGLNDLPAFTSVKLDVALCMVGDYIHFKAVDIEEHYSIKYGILTPQCTGRSHIEFTINQPVTLPL